VGPHPSQDRDNYRKKEIATIEKLDSVLWGSAEAMSRIAAQNDKFAAQNDRVADVVRKVGKPAMAEANIALPKGEFVPYQKSEPNPADLKVADNTSGMLEMLREIKDLLREANDHPGVTVEGAELTLNA
jgi:hypothetical protein